MTHRGPFQPLLFCDSVILSAVATVKVRRMIIKYVPCNTSCKGPDKIRFNGRRRGEYLNVKPGSHLNTVRTYTCTPQCKGKAGARRTAPDGCGMVV